MSAADLHVRVTARVAAEVDKRRQHVGLSRSAYVGRVLTEAMDEAPLPPGAVPSHAEVLRTLDRLAQGGSAAAATALARELRMLEATRQRAATAGTPDVGLDDEADRAVMISERFAGT